MSGICLECLSSNLTGVEAVVGSVLGVSSLRNRSLLSLLIELRPDFIAMSHLVDRALSGEEPEHLSGSMQRESTAEEVLDSIREAIMGLEKIAKRLRSICKGHIIAETYARFALFPLLRSMADRLEDLGGAVRSCIGNSGDYVSSDELLRRLG